MGYVVVIICIHHQPGLLLEYTVGVLVGHPVLKVGVGPFYGDHFLFLPRLLSVRRLDPIIILADVVVQLISNLLVSYLLLMIYDRS